MSEDLRRLTDADPGAATAARVGLDERAARELAELRDGGYGGRTRGVRPGAGRAPWLAPAAAAVASLLLIGVVMGWAARQDPRATSSTATGPAQTGSSSAEAMVDTWVIDRQGHVTACLGPQPAIPPGGCLGVRLANWSWEAVPPGRVLDTSAGSPSTPGDASYRTGGPYRLVGTYDGTVFHLTRPVTIPPPGSPGPPDQTDFATPCAVPPGGWRVVDPGRLSATDLSAVQDAARKLDGFGALWFDSSAPGAERGGLQGLDYTRVVVNVSVTGDVAAAERALRALWGGPMCVSHADLSFARKAAIQEELHRYPGVLTSGQQVRTIWLEVIDDRDGAIQRDCDARYGAGVVRVTSALTAYRP